MGFVANVARRGGVYWWRGRIGPGQPARVVAKSLRTRDPEIARVLGSQITGLAMHLRQSVRHGVMTVEEAESEISAFLSKFPFAVDPKVLARLDADVAERVAGTKPGCLDYAAAQEWTMLADFAKRMGPILERRAAEVRTRPLLVLDGIAEDWVADAIRADRAQAEVCRLLALSGTSARVRPEDRADLLRAGFSEAEIEDIDARTQRHAPREAGTDWLIGPHRDVLVFHLQAVGAVPTMENVSRLRRACLFVLTDLLRTHVHRYLSVPDHYASIVTRATHQAVATMADQADSENQKGSATSPVPPSREKRTEGDSATVVKSEASFLSLVKTLIQDKTQTKSREWDDKTARQHLSIAKLFAKVAMTDDPALMSQDHVGSYLSLLRIIPTHYGKSSADEDRTIDEILARSEDLDDDEIGLAPPTINRHRGQLGNILKFMKRRGFDIGLIDEDSRAKDKRSAEEKRSAFTIDDGRQLLRVVDQKSRDVECVDPEALFWVPLVAWYQMLRLSEAAGLAPEDIDLVAGLIRIRPNDLRRIKTHSSKRTLPIHPELRRLGFCEFAARRQAEGSKQLFPNLFKGKSEFGAVFQKMWAPVLDAALPAARVSRKTLHSTRKTGNSAMHRPEIMPDTRLYIMGHAKVDVNGKHYLTPPSVTEMLEALSFLHVVTADILPRFGAS